MSFSVGDRVVLQGLTKAEHLNGRHGCIGVGLNETSGRYGVDLDLLDTASFRVFAKPANIILEAPIPADTERAGAENGILVEEHGRAISAVLDAVRYLVGGAIVQQSDIQSMDDIHKLRTANDQTELIRLNQITAMAWSYWNHPVSFHGAAGKGLYGMLKEYIQKHIPEQNGGLEAMDPSFRRIYNAIDDIAAVKGWNVRVHGDFWIVGQDNDGTLLVPDVNRQMVYRCLGIRSALYDMLKKTFARPVKMKLTMIPWYGRLVYDGVVTPTDGLRQPIMASDALAQKLHNAVEKAKREGRVVERLAQLEVPGGSHDGLGPPGQPTQAAGPKEQTPPTEKERLLIAKFEKFQPYPEPKQVEKSSGVWTFRRMGYTEHENPSHEGVILSGNGVPVGMFKCSSLAPNSEDILRACLKAVRQNSNQKKRPWLLAIDDRECCDRVEFLLSSVEGSCAHYYMPPTPEETAAAMAGPPPSREAAEFERTMDLLSTMMTNAQRGGMMGR